MFHAISRRGALLLLAAGLSGCKLIDQSTFRGPPPPAPPAPPPPPPPPLPPAVVTIHPESGLDLQSALAPVVRAVKARKPDAEFDVVSVGATPDAVASLAPTAVQAGNALRQLGVTQNRIRVSALLDIRVAMPEVRIQAH